MATPTTNEKKVSRNDYICDDIAFSILSKLPVKSVKRFSCASKSWSLLFENLNFLNKFRNNLVSKPIPLYDDDDACLLFKQIAPQTTPETKLSLGLGEEAIILNLDLPSIFNVNYANPDIDILGSAINGIICLYDYDDHTNVILCNPYTQEIKFVPYTPTKFQLPDDTDDTPDSFWEVYSLKSNAWRRLNVDNIPVLNDTPVGLEVYLDGICHWLGTKDEETYHVVSFNLSNEVFFTIPIDEYVPYCFKLAVLNGSLAMITMNDKTMSFSISILGEIGVKESRTTIFNVGPLSFSIKHIIAAGKKGNIYFSKERSGKIACFDLTSGMIEEIDLEGTSYIDQVVFYKKSPNRIEELINN
ncbi:F-box protein At1g53790-like [Trifolium pratense]|uniref:F-box protein At1g53790-like n=1 Tax=Trifolium pratense TaxID=57577 RepID=UPI001E6920AF|nr:F-box protein At1g53790-like [Trifolium pratense]